MRRWRFALAILFVAVVVAGAMGAASPARAQSDAELKALNEQVVAAPQSCQIPGGDCGCRTLCRAHQEQVRRGLTPNTQLPSVGWPNCCRPPTGWPRPSRSSARARHRREELRTRPSQRRHRPQQPGRAAAGHQPAGRGRAALIAARSPSTRRASAPSIPTSPETSTTWPSCCRTPTGWPRPSR